MCRSLLENTQHVLHVFLKWFPSWKVYNRTTPSFFFFFFCRVLLSVQNCNQHHYFVLIKLLCISLESKWCSHIVVQIQLQFRNTSVLFYQKYQITYDWWSVNSQRCIYACVGVTFSKWFIATRYVKKTSNFRGWPFNHHHHHHHHHHYVLPPAWISQTFSRHSSLSFIASGRSSGLYPVASQSYCTYVRAGRPAFARPYMGVHRSTSLMSSSLFLQQCPACLVRVTWIIFVMGVRWPYSWFLVGCYPQDLFNIARNILV